MEICALVTKHSFTLSNWNPFSLSPGDLSRRHGFMNGSGTADCRRCHVLGSGSMHVTNGLCGACHRDIEGDLRSGSGIHGSSSFASRSCGECHDEHQGTSFDIINGPDPKAKILGVVAPASAWGVAMQNAAGYSGNFDHRLTGVPLPKAIAFQCDACHPPGKTRPGSSTRTYRGATMPTP